MNKLGLALLIAICIVLGVWWNWQKKPLAAIAPKQCMFHVDTMWSTSFQKKMMQVIADWYKDTKNPVDVIEKVTKQYHEVAGMQSQICSADKICFYIQGFQPLFLLNQQYVVDTSGSLSHKDNFDETVVRNLMSIESDQEHQIQQMVFFVENIAPDVGLQHVALWRDQHAIILSDPSLTQMQLVTSVDHIPNIKMIEVCKQLHDQYLAGQKKKNKKNMMTYDLRFKNQIIVRSGG